MKKLLFLAFNTILCMMLCGCANMFSSTEYTWIDGKKCEVKAEKVEFVNQERFNNFVSEWEEPSDYSFHYSLWWGDSGPSTIADVTVTGGIPSAVFQKCDKDSEKFFTLTEVCQYFNDFYEARKNNRQSDKAYFYSVSYKPSANGIVPQDLCENVIICRKGDSPCGYGDLRIYVSAVSVK